MAMLVFVGLYLEGRRAIISGVLIASLAAFFLILTAGKSAMALCVVTLVLSVVVAAIENMLVRACLCFLPLLCLNLLTVGSVFSERLAAVAKLLPFDATFTRRTDISDFPIPSLPLHPFLRS